LGDPQEVKAFFYDLLDTGQSLGVAMPAMLAFETDIKRFVSPQSPKLGWEHQ